MMCNEEQLLYRFNPPPQCDYKKTKLFTVDATNTLIRLDFRIYPELQEQKKQSKLMQIARCLPWVH